MDGGGGAVERAGQDASLAFASASTGAAAAASELQRRCSVLWERLHSQRRHFATELGIYESASASRASFLIGYRCSIEQPAASSTTAAVNHQSLTERARPPGGQSVGPRPEAVREARDFVRGLSRGGTDYSTKPNPDLSASSVLATDRSPQQVHQQQQQQMMTPLRRAKALVGDEWFDLSKAQQMAAVEKVAQIYAPEEDAAWHGAEAKMGDRHARRQHARDLEEASHRAHLVLEGHASRR